MARNPVEGAFLSLLQAIEEESERLQASIREAVSQADVAKAQIQQEKLKKLLTYRASLLKAHRKWQQE